MIYFLEYFLLYSNVKNIYSNYNTKHTSNGVGLDCYTPFVRCPNTKTTSGLERPRSDGRLAEILKIYELKIYILKMYHIFKNIKNIFRPPFTVTTR
jgi:hypothetical protein